MENAHQDEALIRAQQENLLFEEACKCSISARFGLAMCYLGEFAHRNRIECDAFDELRNQLWACPVIPAVTGELDDWLSSVSEPDEETLESFFSDSTLVSVEAVSRLKRLIEYSNSLLQISFWGAGEDEGTYELLKRISAIARPQAVPSIAPFKFSTFEHGDGWGPAMSKSDLEFWKLYSETWFKWTS